MAGRNIGTIGQPMSHLWEWTLSFRQPTTNIAPEFSLDSLNESALAATVMASKSKLARYSAIMAIDTTISVARGVKPKQIEHSDKLILWLSQMLYGWNRDDPPTLKTLPVKADVPKLLSTLGTDSSAHELDKVVGICH